MIRETEMPPGFPMRLQIGSQLNLQRGAKLKALALFAASSQQLWNNCAPWAPVAKADALERFQRTPCCSASDARRRVMSSSSMSTPSPSRPPLPSTNRLLNSNITHSISPIMFLSQSQTLSSNSVTLNTNPTHHAEHRVLFLIHFCQCSHQRLREYGLFIEL